jgi:chromosome segregation ATPase
LIDYHSAVSRTKFVYELNQFQMAHRTVLEDRAILDQFLGDEGVIELVSQLVKKPYKRLVLRGNCLGEPGAAALADYIGKTEVLEELSLEWNQIGSAGARHIARALERNVSLTTLDLRNNNIRNDGAVALAEAMTINKSLRSIDLRWNRLEDGGATAFKAAILNRVPRLMLQVSGNHLSGECATQVDNWLEGEDDDEASSSASESKNQEINFSRSAESQNARDNMMKAEALQLRQDMMRMQEEVSSLNKQLESSAMRVTEQEQAVLKEGFRADTLDEQLRSANIRITNFTDEIASLNREWEKDRQEAAALTRKAITEKDVEIAKLTAERDAASAAQRRDAAKAERCELNLEEQRKAIEEERARAQQEIVSLQSKLTALSLSESQKISQVSSLEGRVKLAEATSAQFEKDLATTRESSEAELKREMTLREEMESKMKSDYEGQLSASADKVQRQSKELQLLYTKVSQLQSELASKVAEFEFDKDKAVQAARHEEAKRTEATLADQKQKIDLFLSGRSELQQRCDEYLKELSSAQETQKAANEQFATQVASAEAETTRLRAQLSELKQENTANKNNARESQQELNTLQERISRLSDLNEEQATQLTTVNTESAALKTKNRELELKVSQHHAQRAMEFSNIMESVTMALGNEFDQLQNKMKIKVAAANDEDEDD